MWFQKAPLTLKKKWKSLQHQCFKFFTVVALIHPSAIFRDGSENTRSGKKSWSKKHVKEDQTPLKIKYGINVKQPTLKAYIILRFSFLRYVEISYQCP